MSYYFQRRFSNLCHPDQDGWTVVSWSILDSFRLSRAFRTKRFFLIFQQFLGMFCKAKPILNIRMFSKRDAFMRFFIVVGGVVLTRQVSLRHCPLELLHALPPNFFYIRPMNFREVVWKVGRQDCELELWELEGVVLMQASSVVFLAMFSYNV
jgi:hypothetical protein